MRISIQFYRNSISHLAINVNYACWSIVYICRIKIILLVYSSSRYSTKRILGIEYSHIYIYVYRYCQFYYDVCKLCARVRVEYTWSCLASAISRSIIIVLGQAGMFIEELLPSRRNAISICHMCHWERWAVKIFGLAASSTEHNNQLFPH